MKKASLGCISAGFLAAVAMVQALVIEPPRPPQRPITDMVVLGDSYSDSCNVYKRDNSLTHRYPFPTCPPNPKGRADGGRSWPEWIRVDQHQVESKGSPPGGSPVKGHGSNQWNIVNLAQSGAVCDNNIFGRAVPDVGQQTHLYQTRYNTTAPAGKIYTNASTTVLALFIGTNDVTIINNGTGNVRQETACVKRRLEKLHDLGFRRFLVFENIKLQDAPLLNTPDQRRRTKVHVRQDNQEQARLFTELNLAWKHDGSHIETFPAFALFERFHDRNSEYGFTVVDEPCGACKNPDEHLWYDALHPSSRAFHILARKVVRFLGGARGEHLLRGSEGL
ncbi:hypothetical protein FA10DRAFT_290661 [Acaromyces ingoldii]|uniref:SGNH hydrolase n=1 Tax=Acaromyces ingoldii TaxID=215250 RepID=A0A316Z052_9BASI|nr:hypothetical protein FA10DRAFT_290661 [Acaromyces ingoldii]PWN93465.1 hypothetical protein FA10DRAFT_290661 [Acaromyces ingoldii]